MPTPVLSLQSPFQTLFQTEPNYNKLRIFGCLCFPWLRPYAANKLDSRSKPCIFLGYSLTQSAYLCLDPTKHRIYSSRHVQFDESQFPFLSLHTTTENSLDLTPTLSASATQLPIPQSPLISANSAPTEPAPASPDSDSSSEQLVGPSSSTSPSVSRPVSPESAHETTVSTDEPSPANVSPSPSVSSHSNEDEPNQTIRGPINSGPITFSNPTTTPSPQTQTTPIPSPTTLAQPETPTTSSNPSSPPTAQEDQHQNLQPPIENNHPMQTRGKIG